MRYPFASKLIQEIAPSMGIRVELEPEYEYAGELIFSNGKRHLFRNTNFNVNPAGSTEIAKDKCYTSYFLRKHGFNVPDSKAFFSDKLNKNLTHSRGIAEAIAYAKTLGFPVFIKPNNLSQGVFVTKVHEPDEIVTVANRIFERTDVFLIESACIGKDYRVVVLGEEIISGYERIPLTVTGNGQDSIQRLLDAAHEGLEHQGRPNSEITTDDSRIDLKLKRLGLTRDSVIQDQEKIFLLDNANLSTGGTSLDVTGKVHPSFLEIAIKATKALGLTLSGVDIICEDITNEAQSQAWNIIEINAAPGLDNYSALGEEQAARVRDLYRKILLYLEKYKN